MSEWKSFTVGGADDSSDESTPFFSIPAEELAPQSSPTPEPSSAASLEADQMAAKWDTKVEDVTIERIEQVVAGDGLPHGSNEVMVLTELDGHRIQIHREPADSPWLQIETRVELSEEDQSFSAYDLRVAANEWNTKHLQPTVFPVRFDERWGFVLATRFFVGEGMSDRQIHTMIRRGLSVSIQAIRALPGDLTPNAD
ncbi:histidine kinase [Schaalia vaccimaxillae]|uniref:histidine kinase n=1 Tax=Schaalia vaccimaxillae TaxID=183916 RepID=UPI0003B69FDC|nr:histidine kinase [Schaalia vaccimaxillae]